MKACYQTYSFNLQRLRCLLIIFGNLYNIKVKILLTKIATLGPQGTFSEIATKQYLINQGINAEIIFYPTLKKSLTAIGDETSQGMLPVENFSEGFVNLVLDHLLDADLYICGELSLPIQFSLVGNCQRIEEIEKIFVQFVAKGQCSEFLDKVHHANIILTESNTQSLAELEQHQHCAAIVPSHLLLDQDFSLKVNNVTDFQNNQTRFVYLSKQANDRYDQLSQDYKTSIIVLYHKDHPGYLESVLHEFTTRSINLTSIVSRPTRHTFGKYHFFIDLEGHQQEQNIKEALDAIKAIFKVKVLGSYLKC